MLERLMIVSGESSGELYGALLAKTLKDRNPDITIIGVGGDRMQTAGVNLISRISSSFGITEAIKTYSEIKRTFKKVVSALKSFNPQVIVLIDYPDFNMKVAREAKKLGIKVLYYVSPQVWAWRKGRVNTLGKLVDKMAVILPFEEEIYRNADIPCEFVGHPVLDEIREVINGSGFRIQDIETEELKAAVRKELGLIPDRPVMTLMPGSRAHEIKKLLPVMSDVIREMKERYPDYQFVMPIAPNLSHDALSGMNELEKNTHHALRFTHHAIKTLIASDLAVIASGTSALQAALVGVSTVVVYKLSPLTYFIGRLIVKVKHISLVNILLDYIEGQGSNRRPMGVKGQGEFFHGLRIKELLQKEAHKENIIMELDKIMYDADYRNEMASQMKRVRKLFLDREASSRAAGIVEELGAYSNV
ncbi:MAG: lipid-A-disaccharide synthase [Nitrospirota bacterium]